MKETLDIKPGLGDIPEKGIYGPVPGEAPELESDHEVKVLDPSKRRFLRHLGVFTGVGLGLTFLEACAPVQETPAIVTPTTGLPERPTITPTLVPTLEAEPLPTEEAVQNITEINITGFGMEELTSDQQEYLDSLEANFIGKIIERVERGDWKLEEIKEFTINETAGHKGEELVLGAYLVVVPQEGEETYWGFSEELKDLIQAPKYQEVSPVWNPDEARFEVTDSEGEVVAYWNSEASSWVERPATIPFELVRTYEFPGFGEWTGEIVPVTYQGETQEMVEYVDPETGGFTNLWATPYYLKVLRVDGQEFPAQLEREEDGKLRGLVRYEGAYQGRDVDFVFFVAPPKGVSAEVRPFLVFSAPEDQYPKDEYPFGVAKLWLDEKGQVLAAESPFVIVSPTPEAVSIPESIFPEYGVFVSEIRTKEGEDWGGLVIADLPGMGEYMVYMIFSLGGGRTLVKAYPFTVTEVEPGVYVPKKIPLPIAIKELRTEGEALKGVVSKEGVEYEFTLEAEGQGRTAVLDAVWETKRREMNLGPPSAFPEGTPEEKIIEDLKFFGVILP